MLRLGTLALRRMLPPWLLLGLVALLVLAARSSGSVPLLAADEHDLASLRALARQNAWSVLLVLAPLLFWQAARLGTPAAAAWLATTPAPRAALALALLSGCGLACAAATALTALASEAVAGSGGPAWRRARTLESPVEVLLDDGQSLRWSIAAPAAGRRLRLWTTVAPGSGPAVTACFRARAGSEACAVERRIAGRTVLELEPPRALADRLELELERVGPGALLVVPPEALELLEPVASERLTALAFGSRALLFLATGCALALGLASLVRAGLAAALVLALALLSWSSPLAARVVPGADFPDAWRELGAGLVPASVPGASLAGAVALCALGLASSVRAPRGRERRA